MAERWYTILYPEMTSLRSCLDALIFLSNPTEKDGAHITLRGPYDTRGAVPEISPELSGSEVSVFGAGQFFGEKQNTVYLRCDSPIIEKYWRKPDYPYNPHITIYDGQSREFAEKLYTMLKLHRLYMTLTIGEVLVKSSVKGQRSLNLLFGVDLDRISSVVGEPVDLRGADAMPDWRRLAMIDRICSKMMWIVRT